MSDGATTAHLPGLDLEKELSCSICTDVLYQPLTLLDCLHTYCGACLKEWFLSQASRATSLHPYTCPACRSSVRATKHNATVATLLDMYLQANPTKARLEDEKKEINKIYKAGDNVLPKLRRRGRRNDDEEEQRVLNEVMVQSLQDVGISGNTSDSTSRRRSDHISRERRSSAGATARPEGRQAGMYLHNQNEPRSRGRNTPREDPRATPSRSLDHQSSLRSLLSVSESDVEEDILRHIMEDGLLEGVDLNNMTTAQEEELSERIAAAYRRRQDEQRRARRAAETAVQSVPDRSNHRSRERSRHHSRPRVVTSTAFSDAVTTSPVHLRPGNTTAPQIVVPATEQSTAIQGSRSHSRHRSVSADNSAALGVPRTVSRPAARSASNLPLPAQPDARSTANPPVAYNNRRSTEPAGRTSSDGRPPALDSNSNTERAPPSRLESDSLAAALPSSRLSISPRRDSHTFPFDLSRPRSSHSAVSAISGTSAVSIVELPGSIPVAAAPLVVSHPASPQFVEPSITCRHCRRTHIEYELHYSCFKCDSAGYHLCIQCYRHAEGCLHWFGFGWGAWQKYNRSKSGDRNATLQPPHIMTAMRYKRPQEATTNIRDGMIPDQDPKSRLETGAFCDMCHSSANNWYWRCDICNEGEWGYCNSCVNQGLHCTHPLLSLSFQNTSPTSPTSPLDPQIESANRLLSFTPKSFTTQCDICTYSIPPSHTRYHCSKCNGGDYDIHANCYTSLVKTGRVSHENGNKGWRRCLNGHRMVIIGFEDRDGGQKRIVDRDIAGGEALKEEEAFAMTIIADTTQDKQPSTPPPNQLHHPGWRWTDPDGTTRFLSPSSTSPSPMPSPSAIPATQLPPDGGVGLRLQAKWGYFPAEPDELMFPKGAEIKEAEDINGDWYWGVYAGSKGLFPGNYGRVVGRQ